MKKKRSWLSRAVIFTGLVVVMLLIMTINSSPLLVQWFPTVPIPSEPERAMNQESARAFYWYDVVGTSLISMLIVLLIMSHLGLLIIVAKDLNKPHKKDISNPTLCPQCSYNIQSDWKLCPKCGYDLQKSNLKRPHSI